MTQRHSQKQLPIFFLLISLVIAILLPILTFCVPSVHQSIPYEKEVIGIIFGTICILGIVAGIIPSRCSQVFHFKREQKELIKTTKSKEPFKSTLMVKGHHPTCSNYSSHVLRLDSTILCGGCTGLTIGGLLALVSSCLFFFLGWTLPWLFIFYWLGFFGVVVGLLQHSIYKIFRIGSGFVRVIVNVFFVMGSFLLLASTIEITHYFALELYLLLAIIYWIFTRIMISKREHHLVCTKCGDQVCYLSKA
ncbi:MAG: hypothetical protein ACFFDP_00335 [Promethearchaeota archaeon]